MEATRPFRWTVFLLSIVFLVSCVDDDQTNIKPEHKIIANPAPVSSSGDVKQFAKNNARHKVIMGVFDTGVDYNHPYLKDHVHFQLDDKGVPIGAGMDFLALDNWASPRVIATSSYEFEFLSEKQKKKAIDRYKTVENFNNTVRRQRLGDVCAAEELLKVEPRLSYFLHPYRNLDTEADSPRHGTHVAGLMTYDDDDLGIIPYRVLPYYETEQEEADFVAGKADRFVKNFEAALKHARAQGVRLVNLSLGGSFEKPNEDDNANYEREMETYENYKRMLTDEMTKVLKEYPEILFVAAAGNDSGWSDNESRLQYPCGIEASNMLCVGALNNDGSLANFTNLPLNHVNIVMTSGVKVLSTVPADNCRYLRKSFSQFLSGDGNLCKYNLKEKKWKANPEGLAQYKALMGTLYDSCTRTQNYFTEMSGTSMATPIVSHMAADLMKDSQFNTPEKVVEELKRRAQATTKLQIKTYVLKFKQPSWYQMLKPKTLPQVANGAPLTLGNLKQAVALALLPMVQLPPGGVGTTPGFGDAADDSGYFEFALP